MEEKFYYSKQFTWLNIIASLPMMAPGFMILYFWSSRLGASQWSNEKLDWFAAGALLLFLSLTFIFVGVIRLRAVMGPAIILTNNKIIFSPYSIKTNWKPYVFNLRKLKLGFEQIISARMAEAPSVNPFEKPFKAIEVRFRRPSGKEDSFYVFISKISNPEKLIELLKQRIKFV